jgi:hypothetical protein
MDTTNISSIPTKNKNMLQSCYDVPVTYYNRVVYMDFVFRPYIWLVLANVYMFSLIHAIKGWKQRVMSTCPILVQFWPFHRKLYSTKDGSSQITGQTHLNGTRTRQNNSLGTSTRTRAPLAGWYILPHAYQLYEMETKSISFCQRLGLF